jgi:hypothetical protein
MTKWDGVERRKGLNADDHDLLLRIDAKLDHIIDDVKEHDDRLKFHDKVIYGIGGALVIIEVALKVIKI